VVSKLVDLLLARKKDVVLDWVNRWDDPPEKEAEREPRKSRWTHRRRSSERRALSRRRSWDEEEEPYRKTERCLRAERRHEAPGEGNAPPGEGISPSTGERDLTEDQEGRGDSGPMEDEPTPSTEMKLNVRREARERVMKLATRSGAVVEVILSESEDEFREPAEDQAELRRVRHALVPGAPHHLPELDVHLAPEANLQDVEPIDLLDSEVAWKGFFRALAVEVGATLKWRQGWPSAPEGNILDRASKGLFRTGGRQGEGVQTL
jgi:hypothetical protein